MNKILIVMMFIFMVGCSSEEPIKIPKDKSSYFGVWVYKSNAYGNDVKIDNMLLSIYPDSTVSYKRCRKWMNGRKNVSAPEATIIKLTDNELVIKADFFVMSWDLEFVIEKPPYKEKGVWKMKIDGAELRKLRPGEKSDHESWDCDKDED